MKKDFLNLKKKIAFVVGGEGVLGSNIVNLLESYGAKVVVLDLKSKLFKGSKKNIFFEKFDLTKTGLIKQKLEKVSRKYGCPDIYINAAYPRSKKWIKSTYQDLTVPELQHNVNSHLNSFIWSTIKIAEIMKKNKVRGSIILLNSIYGKVAQDKKLYKNMNLEMNPVYAAIKGGLITFIKNLSSYYGLNGIRANSIICGGIDAHIAGSKRKLNNAFKKRYSLKTLINRMGNPSDVASAVLFLSSNVSSYITGSELSVDGGYTAI